jgi:hypothetical protein
MLNRLSDDFTKARMKTGLGYGRNGGLILHDLRRLGARNLRRAGVPESVVMKITGHKTRMIFERYNIVDESTVIAAMNHRETTITAPPLTVSSRQKVLTGESSGSARRRKLAKLIKSSNEVA